MYFVAVPPAEILCPTLSLSVGFMRNEYKYSKSISSVAAISTIH